MAITRVGSAQSISTNNGGTSSITFLTVPLADDYVVAIGGNGTVTPNGSYGPSTAGYTLAKGSNTPSSISFGMWYKKMGVVPDTSIAFVGDGLAADSSAYAIMILRGVDPTNPLDSTPSQTTLTNGTGVSVNTLGATVLSAGAISNNVAPTAAPSGYTLWTTRTGLDTNKIGIGLAYVDTNFIGTEDPGAFTWTLTAPQSFITAAFKPYVAPAGAGFEGWGIPI